MKSAFLYPRDYVDRIPLDADPWNAKDSLAYTQWLATHHYENFHVVSLLMPKALRQHFFNIYSFCRWADDLGDEMGEAGRSLHLLAWWREQLHAMYCGDVAHPVFVALWQTVNQFGIPIDPFERLITAFEQDQTVNRYQNFHDLIGYCQNSANPVGHLVLYLWGYSDAERQLLADFTCTGLQMANFWQDVTVDLKKDRVYIPLDLLAQYNYSLDDLHALRRNKAIKGVIREAVFITEEFFRRGAALNRKVTPRLALNLELFERGGLKVLSKIKLQEYDVLRKRPVISTAEKLGILIQCLPRLLF